MIFLNKTVYFLFFYFLFGTNETVNAQFLINDEAQMAAFANYANGAGMDVDMYGSTYAVLNFNSDINFYDGTLISSGSTKMFKHDKFGNLLWTKSYGPTGSGSFNNLKINQNNQVFVSGYNSMDLVPASLDPSNYFLNTYLIARVDSSGEIVNAERFPRLPFFDVTENGTVAFTFGMNGSGYLGSNYLTMPSGQEHIVYGELSANGSLLWYEIYSEPYFIYTNTNLLKGCSYRNGKLYIHGYFEGSFNVGASSITLTQTAPNDQNEYPSNFVGEIDFLTHQVIRGFKTENMIIKGVLLDDQNRIYLSAKQYVNGALFLNGNIAGQTYNWAGTNNHLIRLKSDFTHDVSYDVGGPTGNIRVQQMELHNNGIYLAAHNDFGISTFGSQTYPDQSMMFIVHIDSTLNLVSTYGFPYNYPNTGEQFMRLSDFNDDDGELSMYVKAPAPINTGGMSFTNTHFIGKYKSNANRILGKVFKDFNSSGIYDSGDILLNGSIVENNPGALSTVVNIDGTFLSYVDSGTYNFSVPNVPNYFTAQPASTDVIFNGFNQLSLLDLPLIPVPGGHDLRVDFIPLTQTVVMENVTHKIIITNEGTYTESGTLIVKPLQYSLPMSTPITTPLMTTVGGNLEYSFSNFSPGDTFSLLLNYTIPLSFLPIIGEIDTTSASVNIGAGISDADSTNNYVDFQSSVLSGFDPNVKLVNRMDEIPFDSLQNFTDLGYTIHFQNSGNFPVSNILIIDTLSNFLIENTFDLIETSHQVETIKNGDVIKFYFYNINLPSVNDDVNGSKGYIHFNIHKINNLNIGDTISNRAYIYFGYNPAIVTNDALTIVVENPITEPNSVDKQEMFEEIIVSPNPFNSQIKIELNDLNEVSLKLMNVNGKCVYSENSNTSQVITIDTSKLAFGIYFLDLSNNDLHKIVKLIKQ